MLFCARKNSLVFTGEYLCTWNRAVNGNVIRVTSTENRILCDVISGNRTARLLQKPHYWVLNFPEIVYISSCVRARETAISRGKIQRWKLPAFQADNHESVIYIGASVGCVFIWRKEEEVQEFWIVLWFQKTFLTICEDNRETDDICTGDRTTGKL